MGYFEESFKAYHDRWAFIQMKVIEELTFLAGLKKRW